MTTKTKTQQVENARKTADLPRQDASLPGTWAKLLT
jgi:hypothetical protein